MTAGSAEGVLDRTFDAGTLAGLREAVLGCATECGMPEDRAIDVMLVVHELAANSVRHGPGHGRVRMRVTDSSLRCEVSDPGLSRCDGHSPTGTGQPSSAVPWPVEQGHGLWLALNAADRLLATCGPQGSLVAAVFSLPRA